MTGKSYRTHPWVSFDDAKNLEHHVYTIVSTFFLVRGKKGNRKHHNRNTNDFNWKFVNSLKRSLKSRTVSR